jgi:glycosyltransferase involved in cell wall biosynthesis
MIIGIDASRANRSHKSGTEWYSYYLIKELAKIDSKNQYVLYSDQPLRGGLLDLTSDNPSQDRLDFEIDKHGYQKLISPHNNFQGKVLSWPLKFFWTQGRLSWEMFTRKPDVLFVPAHALPLIHPKKSVVTIHDIGYKEDKNLYSKEKIGYEPRAWDWLILSLTGGKHRATSLDYLDWSTNFALKSAAKIITISDFSKQEIIKHYQTDPKKIVVVHNGYNDDLFHQNYDDKKLTSVLDTYGIERPYIFYVGRLEKKKNIASLVEAFAIAKHDPNFKHKLYLVGDASFGYDEIKYLINEFDLVGEVVTTGWVEEAHLPYIFKGADAFIFPTKYEGFGIPLLQAMAAGTPIAASDVSAIPEIAGDAALLFDPENVKDISEKILKIVKNKELKDKLRQAGLKRVSQFSWEKCAQETLKVIEKL